MIKGQKLIRHATLWLLRNLRQPLDIAATVLHFAPGVAELVKSLPKLLMVSDRTALKKAARRFVNSGVSAELANRVASLDRMFPALDIVEVAKRTGFSVEEVASVYFRLGARLELHWLRNQIAALPVNSHWQTLANATLYDGLYSQHRALTAEVLQMTPKARSAETRIEVWLAQNRAPVERFLQVLADLKTSGTIELAMLSVALREIRSLVQSGEPGLPTARASVQGGERTAEV